MAEEPKKNIFNAAIDALTNRDEKAAEAAQKAAAEAAQKAAAEAAQRNAADAARKAAEAAKYEADAAKAALEKSQAEAAAARNQIAEMEQKARAEREAEAARQILDRQNAWNAAQTAAAATPVVKHVWTNEDTYASLAQKYYGSFQEPYWRLIYDHNKAIIGNHPNAIRTGLEIEIPPLPDELKKK